MGKLLVWERNEEFDRHRNQADGEQARHLEEELSSNAEQLPQKQC